MKQISVKTTISALCQKVKDFRKDQAGNIAMILGLSAVPIMLAAGSAIDYSRIANAKSNLVSGLDSSALYAASITGKTPDELKELARNYLDVNYKNTGDAPITDFGLQNYADKVVVTGTVDVKTWFMSLGGITHVSVPGTSEVKKAGNSIEVALLLDNTNSMTPSLQALKDAANKFVTDVVWEDTVPYYSKVALIPYNMGVNLGTNAVAARGTIAAGTSATPGSTNFTFKNTASTPVDRTLPITNCVSERIGAQAYTDSGVSGAPVGRVYAPSANPCISTELRPLTNDKTKLAATINAMTAGSSSAGQVGIAWGWYALSSDFGLWSGESVPAAYGTPRVKKIMILMTDAEYNSSYCKGVITGVPNVTGSGGSSDHINCAATNGTAYAQSKTLCTNMKAKGIEIYTIEFELNTSIPQRVQLMQDCATDATHRIVASDAASLNAAFSQIAQNLLELRVSR